MIPGSRDSRKRWAARNNNQNRTRTAARNRNNNPNKMLIWSQNMDEKALRGMARQQFAKYGLLRLGIGENITRIERNGVPRRVAPAEEVYALRPQLKLPS